MLLDLERSLRISVLRSLSGCPLFLADEVTWVETGLAMYSQQVGIR